MSAIYLGVDMGTTSAKCLTIGEDGNILAFSQCPYPMSHPRQGWAEQHPGDYWKALVHIVRECVRQCKEKGYNSDQIKALAMSTQGNTLIPTDSSGTPLAPAFSWMDSRAEAQYRALSEEAGDNFWYHETGSRLTPLSPVCKVRWIKENDPELALRITRYCAVPDYLAVKLCGRFIADIPSASWSPFFSTRERKWSQKVMDLLGVSKEAFPQVLESGEPIGELLPEVASEMELCSGTMLVAGAFDQAAAAHGAGARAGEISVLSCGTAWVLYSIAASPPTADQLTIPICCHVRKSEWGMVMPFTGGSAYDWLQRTFNGSKESGEGKAEPLIFIPHLYGGLSPDWRGKSKGSLLGLTMAHTWQDVEQAMMRGLAFESRRNVEAAEQLSGGIPSIRMVGGASKSNTWPQIIADVLDKPVEVSDFTESACYGAAKLAAGEASYQWQVEETKHQYLPYPENAAFENKQYARYLEFYNALTALYEG